MTATPDARDVEDDDDDDATVVVNRTPEEVEEEEEEETVVVDRTDDEKPDETVVVDHEDDESTVVVTSRAPSKPAPEIVESTSSEAVSQSAPTSSTSSTSSTSKFSGSTSGASNSSGPMLKPARSRTRSRPELRPAPVPVGFGRVAQEAIGVGAIMSYDATTSAPVVATSHAMESGPLPTRAPTPSMPSVERSSRRTALISLAAVAGACVVSLGGLIALIAALVTGR